MSPEALTRPDQIDARIWALQSLSEQRLATGDLSAALPGRSAARTQPAVVLRTE